jgi:AraC-like DNA-binding protein
MPGFPSDGAALRAVTDRYLAACFQRQTPPRASELAAALGVSAHRLTRAFQQLLQTTPSAYLKRAQLALAKLLLRTTAFSMNEVAYAAAFGTRMSFFRAFRRATGMTPAQYRTQIMLLDMHGSQSVPSAARKSPLTETPAPEDHRNGSRRL